jgi:hypothetical protein
MSPALDFLLKTVLAIEALLGVHNYFMIDFPISVQNVIGILMRIALNM